MTIRVGSIHPNHRTHLEEIVRATGVFSDDEVRVALELFDEAIANNAPLTWQNETSVARPYSPRLACDYEFVGAFDSGNALLGYACFGPTPATDRTYDLYWIAVHPNAQRTGAGAALMAEVERQLEERRGRLVVIETSSRDDYAPTRRFYHKRGYHEAARLRDFYAPGDDRVVLSKRLNGSNDPGGSVAARPLPG